MADAKPIPDGYPRVMPYLVVDGASAAIDFYKEVFGATERLRMPGPDGNLAHAEVEIGDSVVMLADPFPGEGAQPPGAYGGSPVSMMVYVEDVDAVFETAVKAGAKAALAVEDQFYGDRRGVFTDPFGHTWNVASHVEDVAPDEMGRRADAVGRGEDWRK